MQCYFFVFILSVNKALKQLQVSFIFHMNCRLSSEYRFLQRSRYMKIRICIYRTCMILHGKHDEWLCGSRCREFCAESFMASYSLLRAKGFYHRPLTFFWSWLHFQGWRKTWESQNFCSIFTALTFLSVLTCESPSLDFFLVCVASVSVGLGSKRLTPLSFFGSRPIFRTGKHRKPRSSVLLCSQTPRKRLLRRLDFFFFLKAVSQSVFFCKAIKTEVSVSPLQEETR